MDDAGSSGWLALAFSITVTLVPSFAVVDGSLFLSLLLLLLRKKACRAQNVAGMTEDTNTNCNTPPMERRMDSRGEIRRLRLICTMALVSWLDASCILLYCYYRQIK